MRYALLTLSLASLLATPARAVERVVLAEMFTNTG